jgi:hypothetical protein
MVEKMADEKEIKRGYSKPERVSFPDEEAIYDWLSMLLDAYHVIDTGIAEAIKTAKKRGRKVACSKGCFNCCETHHTIPVYPLELIGISWYAMEKFTGPERDSLRKQLADYRENSPCPFLLEGACSIHPIRPISCRQFIVFGNPCIAGEDPYYTRRKDVLTPIQRYVDRAFFIMLPFYGIKDEAERIKVIKGRLMHKMVKLMQTCNWKSLAEKMGRHNRE